MVRLTSLRLVTLRETDSEEPDISTEVPDVLVELLRVRRRFQNIDVRPIHPYLVPIIGTERYGQARNCHHCRDGRERKRYCRTGHHYYSRFFLGVDYEEQKNS